MKKAYLLLLLLPLVIYVLTSCITQNVYIDEQYLCVSDNSIALREAANEKSEIVFVIPYGRQFISKKYSAKRNYWTIKYGKHQGYAKKPKFKTKNKIDNATIDLLSFDEENGYSLNRYKSDNEYKYTPSSTSSGGTVHVKGYYRKDGTYVRPHTRRSPSRRK